MCAVMLADLWSFFVSGRWANNFPKSLATVKGNPIICLCSHKGESEKYSLPFRNQAIESS